MIKFEVKLIRIGMNFDYKKYKEKLFDFQYEKMPVVTWHGFVFFPISEKIFINVGAGIKNIRRVYTHTGLNFMASMDYFLCKPFRLSTEIQYGRVGGADVFYFSPEIGIIFKRIETGISFNFHNFSGETIKGCELKTTLWY